MLASDTTLYLLCKLLKEYYYITMDWNILQEGVQNQRKE